VSPSRPVHSLTEIQLKLGNSPCELHLVLITSGWEHLRV
jgi:hypothetical protein